MPKDKDSSKSKKGSKARAKLVEPSAPLAPTSIAAWNKVPTATGTFVTELPSGNLAEVRRSLDMRDQLAKGAIPNPLAGIVEAMMNGQADMSSMAKLGETPQGLVQLMQMLDDYTCKTMVSPPVSRPEPMAEFKPPERTKGETKTKYDERVAAAFDKEWKKYTKSISDWSPDPDSLSVFDLNLTDKMYLFSIAQGVATDVVAFREESNAALVAVPAKSGVQHSPKRTGGGAKRR